MSTQLPYNFQVTTESNTQTTPAQETFNNARDQSTVIHSQVSNSGGTGYSFIENAHLYLASTVSLVGGLVLIVGSVWLFVRTWNWFKKDKGSAIAADSYLNAFRSVPCYSCKYFSDNLYIKCAVHPDSVLTQSAYHCRDHCPRENQGG